ncbi:MAG: hypothetical protein NT049_02880 [Planctomycetota bacterium]|nr:hypothetical protein [Planctomycetota bacterium]
MTALGLMERVKGWFGGGNGSNDPSPTRRALGEEALPYASGAIAAVAAANAQRGSCDEVTSPAASAAGSNSSTTLDPLDPEWMQSLEELPRRIAETAADSAAGVRSLEQIAGELEGHRQATRAVAASIKRLPDLALAQGELSRETNKILERQSLVMESMLDSIIDLRSAFKNTEESSRRHLKAIDILETSHRQILFEYQTMFLRSHRRLGYMAAAAAMLAAGALGGVAYVAWYVFATS